MSLPFVAEASLEAQIGVFLASALVILLAGSKMSFLADRIADQTGFGEALTGAVLLGAATSLSGVVTSVWTAWNGFAALAYSNAIGGIAVQSLFLVVADVVYRRINLEHAAADLSNLVNASVLIALLGVMLAAGVGPDVTFFAVHPASILIFAGYLYGLKLARSASRQPMWHIVRTRDTQPDEPDAAGASQPLARTLIAFAVCLALVGGAGVLVGRTGADFVGSLGLSEGIVGTLLTSTVTSLPELVTTIAAVRAGSLQLAVGGIVGGNAFDTLFAALADVAYRDGSIYNAISDSERFLTAVVIAMTGVFVLGMLHRQRQGLGGVGFEGWIVIGLYATGIAGLFAMD